MEVAAWVEVAVLAVIEQQRILRSQPKLMLLQLVRVALLVMQEEVEAVVVQVDPVALDQTLSLAQVHQLAAAVAAPKVVVLPLELMEPLVVLAVVV